MIFFTLFVSVASAQEKSLEEKTEDLCDQGNSTACFKVGERYRTLDRNNKKPLFIILKPAMTAI